MFSLWWEVVSARHLSHRAPKMTVTCVLERERLNSPPKQLNKTLAPSVDVSALLIYANVQKTRPKVAAIHQVRSPEELAVF